MVIGAFTLYHYLHHRKLKRVKREFDKHYAVLTQKDIEGLLTQEGINKTWALRKLRSAIVDHHKVDGIRYHTKYPLDAHLGHGNFRRAFIADGIGDLEGKLQEAEDLSNAVLILDKLTDLEKELGYIQILAWNSLGRIGKHSPLIIADEGEKVKKAPIITHEEKKIAETFNSSSPASALGILLFLEKMLETSGRESARRLIEDGVRGARYEVPRALFCYYAAKSPYFDDPLKQNLKLTHPIRDFLLAVEKGYLFNQDDFNQGLELTGIIKRRQELPFWKGTDHAKVGDRLYQICTDLIPAIGAFFGRGYEKQQRSRGFAFWKLPVRDSPLQEFSENP